MITAAETKTYVGKSGRSVVRTDIIPAGTLREHFSIPISSEWYNIKLLSPWPNKIMLLFQYKLLMKYHPSLGRILKSYLNQFVKNTP